MTAPREATRGPGGLTLLLPQRQGNTPAIGILAFPPRNQARPTHFFSRTQVNEGGKVVRDDLVHEVQLRGGGFLARRRVPTTNPRLVEEMIATAGATHPGQTINVTSLLELELNRILHSPLYRVLPLVGLAPSTPIRPASSFFTLIEVMGCNEDERHDNVMRFIYAIGCRVSRS